MATSSMSCSPNCCRISGQEPSRTWGGRKYTHIESTWRPSGATVLSYTEGIWTWMTGVSAIRPFLASFQLLSPWSTVGQRLIMARCSGLYSEPRWPEKSGSSLSAQRNLADADCVFSALTSSANSSSSSSSSMSVRNVRFGSAFDMTTSAATTSPSTSSTPVALPLLVRMRLTSAPVLIDTPDASAERASDWVMEPMPPRTIP